MSDEGNAVLPPNAETPSEKTTMKTLPDDIRVRIEYDMGRLRQLQTSRRQITAALGRYESVARTYLYKRERDAVARLIKMWRRQMGEHGLDCALMCSECRDPGGHAMVSGFSY